MGILFLKCGLSSGSIVTCAPGWTFFPHTEKCYQHVEKNTIQSWTAAKKGCENTSPAESSGNVIGELASVPDDATNAFLMALSENKRVWLGGIRTENNEWVWADGSAWAYEAGWLPGEPNGDQVTGKYLIMNHFFGGKYGWNDMFPAGKTNLNRFPTYGFICQYHIKGW